MARRIEVDDGTSELLKSLLRSFSVKNAVRWLERKFESFDTSRAREIDVGETKNEKEYFKSARIIGFVNRLPEAKGGEVNRPVLVAVVEMKKIVTEYRMLYWDKPAGRYLALAHLAAGNAQKAYEVCVPIVSEDKTAGWSGDLAAAYWQTLQKLGKTDQLEGLLKKAASSGSRQASAAALVMRGDIIVQGSNDAPEELKKALRDGYMRVVLMYQDAECRRERGDAMLKAAACFDKLGQAARAENLRAQAKAI